MRGISLSSALDGVMERQRRNWVASAQATELPSRGNPMS